MSPVSCEKLAAAKEWLEESAAAFGLTSDLPRSLDELLKLQEQIKAEREVANRHARCVRELKTKVLKKPRRASTDGAAAVPSDAATTEASRKKTAELVSALCARVEAADSSSQLLRLVEHLRDSLQHWPEDQHCHVSPVLEAADRRMEALHVQEAAAKAAKEQEAREEKDQEEELRKLRESKEALSEQLKQARSALQEAEILEEGESTSASQEHASHVASPPSSRSNSDVGLRSETGVSPPRLEPVAATTAGGEGPTSSSPDLPTTQRPSGGKGKSKGLAPPKAKAKPKAAANLAPRSTSNGFQNFFWQVIKENQDREVSKDFLAKLEALRPQGGAVADLDEVPVPKLPETIFNPVAEVPQVPLHVLEQYWKKRDSHVARSRQQSADGPGGEEMMGKASILDEKKLQMLGITLKRHEHLLRKHQTHPEDVNEWQAIASIKQAILRCDFEILQIECLSVIRTVIKQHENDGKPVSVFAEANGEAALRSCRCPEGHCLVFELCKVPQIVDRLECMVFHETFRDNLRNYQQALATHHQALSMLNGKRQTIERFFITALRLGQGLNRSSKKASQAHNGFDLGSLEKLAETKSTKLPKLSVLHFVLALMREEDVQCLASDEDLSLLQEAAMRKTHKVYQDCIELVQGLYSVQNICDTGEYIRPDGEAVTIERRRRTIVPEPTTDEADVDDDDLFFDVMHQFVKDHVQAAEDLGESAFNLILLYKELAIYFDDMRNVYPPPKSENDVRRDLVEVFARFAVQIRRHREQVESERLRQLIGGDRKGSAQPTPAAAG